MENRNKFSNAVKKIKSGVRTTVSAFVLMTLLNLGGCATFPLSRRGADDKKTRSPTAKEFVFDGISVFAEQDEFEAARRLGVILNNMCADAPFIIKTIKKHGMTFIFNGNDGHEDYLAAYSPDENTVIKVNPGFAEILEKAIADGLIADDVDENMAHTIAHEVIHKLQDIAGLFKDIENLPPSEYVCAANFLEIDAKIKGYTHCNVAMFRDIAKRDALLSETLRGWTDYESYTIRNYIRSLFNRPDGRVARLEEILARSAAVGDPAIAAYSPQLVRTISTIVLEQMKRKSTLNFEKADRDWKAKYFPPAPAQHPQKNMGR